VHGIFQHLQEIPRCPAPFEVYSAADLFLARGARRVAEPHPDDLEEQELVLLGRAEIEAALAAGEFRVLPWAAVVALALLRLKE